MSARERGVLRNHMKLSVIIPCYNEVHTIDRIVEAVRQCPYKVFRRDIIQSFTTEENRFGFEPEITAKISKTGCRVFEVGISYYGRTYAEGKKIGWRDGLRAIFCIIKYNLFR